MEPVLAHQLESKAIEKLEEELVGGEGEEDDEVIIQTLSFDRPYGKNASDHCAVCGSDEELPDHARVLEIEFTDYYIVLCEKHEGEFLKKLLNNYIKRVVKNSKVGFTGPLEKEPSCGT